MNLIECRECWFGGGFVYRVYGVSVWERLCVQSVGSVGLGAALCTECRECRCESCFASRVYGVTVWELLCVQS
jgi:hypothetical protein